MGAGYKEQENDITHNIGNNYISLENLNSGTNNSTNQSISKEITNQLVYNYKASEVGTNVLNEKNTNYDNDTNTNIVMENQNMEDKVSYKKNADVQNKSEVNETSEEKQENNSENKRSTSPIKKRPGRPRKTAPQQPKPKLGIVNSPQDDCHHIEFLYDDPSVFKKLWAFFKAMSVDKLHMIFTKENIFIYCVDHHMKSQIRVKIDCSKVNHYYCKEYIDIGLQCKNPELIMGTIDKSHHSILILSTNNNAQKNIQIVLKNYLYV